MKVSKLTPYKIRKRIAIALLLVLLIALPLMLSNKPYIMNVFILIFYTSTMSMAWNLLGGMTGQNSLGHAAYMGLGAYVAALFVTKAGMNPWLSMLLSMLIVGGLAGVIFYPCFLLKGPYFTLVSIAFGETIRQFVINWDFAGKATGISLPFGAESFAEFRFMGKAPYYYIGLAMIIGVYLVMRKISRSKFGFALRTIREDEDVASAIGIKPMRYKVYALIVSSMIAAMVGSFYAYYNRYIDPDLMLQSYSVEFVLPAIVGGAAFVEGPLVGGAILITLSEFLRNEFGAILPGINLILYAVVLLVVIRFRPVGLLGWFSTSKLKNFLETKVLKKSDADEEI